MFCLVVRPRWTIHTEIATDTDIAKAAQFAQASLVDLKHHFNSYAHTLSFKFGVINFLRVDRNYDITRHGHAILTEDPEVSRGLLWTVAVKETLLLGRRTRS